MTLLSELERCGIGGSCVLRLDSLAPLDSGAAEMEQQRHSDMAMKGGAARYQAYGQQVIVCLIVEKDAAGVRLVSRARRHRLILSANLSRTRRPPSGSVSGRELSAKRTWDLR